ncbi:hypothetical protein HHK36_011673 [Tetracentron sinense]|uniref:Uncharacterized protein n=1 Tax=Tetracentron sinense TaxID=13715 RepID=A0A834Z8Q2_TETSI|nr:hypothetical protein HHK36_011673 [Tetracentron sinense]
MVPPPVQAGAGTGTGAAAQNAQFTQQFLSNVLSQRGPSALPYIEDAKWLIRQHLLSLIDTYPSLQPKTATFTHNDGRTVNLLQADGTIPMFYQDVLYNIPIVVWLMETYPRHPPCVYVAPTRDMIIKRPHPHVNPSGLVSIPYLHNWIYPSSNLVDLARNLSHVFARDPPLYSRQRPNPNPNPTPTPNPNPNPTDSSSMVVRPAIPPRVYSASPYGGRLPPSPQRQSEDPNEVFRRNSINKLLESLHGDIAALRKNREAEMEGLFNGQGVLRQREEQLCKGLREMQDEKEGLEQQLQMTLMNTDVLEAWLRENEGKMGNKVTGEIDDVFEPCDALSKQMIECTASDLAIEDVIYSLDKAVQEGSIPFDQYLKNIRSMSREQFFHRATAARVRSAQMQAQVASMASRAASQYVVWTACITDIQLRENEGKMGNKVTVEINDVFEPCDALSKQMIECTASDLAIKDVIYSLDKAVQEGSIPFDQYLKNIRSMSREQFFHRATAARVRFFFVKAGWPIVRAILEDLENEMVEDCDEQLKISRISKHRLRIPKIKSSRMVVLSMSSSSQRGMNFRPWIILPIIERAPRQFEPSAEPSAFPVEFVSGPKELLKARPFVTREDGEASPSFVEDGEASSYRDACL